MPEAIDRKQYQAYILNVRISKKFISTQRVLELGNAPPLLVEALQRRAAFLCDRELVLFAARIQATGSLDVAEFLKVERRLAQAIVAILQPDEAEVVEIGGA